MRVFDSEPHSYAMRWDSFIERARGDVSVKLANEPAMQTCVGELWLTALHFSSDYLGESLRQGFYPLSILQCELSWLESGVDGDDEMGLRPLWRMTSSQ